MRAAATITTAEAPVVLLPNLIDTSDCVLQMMVRKGIPLTRQNYLNLAYPDGLPEDWGAELESELPDVIQRRPLLTQQRKRMSRERKDAKREPKTYPS